MIQNILAIVKALDESDDENDRQTAIALRQLYVLKCLDRFDKPLPTAQPEGGKR